MRTEPLQAIATSGEKVEACLTSVRGPCNGSLEYLPLGQLRPDEGSREPEELEGTALPFQS